MYRISNFRYKYFKYKIKKLSELLTLEFLLLHKCEVFIGFVLRIFLSPMLVYFARKLATSYWYAESLHWCLPVPRPVIPRSLDFVLNFRFPQNLESGLPTLFCQTFTYSQKLQAPDKTESFLSRRTLASLLDTVVAPNTNFLHIFCTLLLATIQNVRSLLIGWCDEAPNWPTNQVVEMKRGILAGCKLKMDDGGNILVKR